MKQTGQDLPVNPRTWILSLNLLARVAFSLLILALLVSACSSRVDQTQVPPAAWAGWQQGTTMPTPRSEMPAAALEGLIYVPGGFGKETAFEAYDPQANTWKALASLPEGRHHLMSVAHAGRVYIFGGARSLLSWAPRSEAWAYDPAEDRWTELASMPEPRLAGAAVSLGDFVYIIGGTGGHSSALLRYDPVQDVWTELAPLSQPREHTAAVALDGQIWALGGRWEGLGELNSVEVYDPQVDRWSPGPALAEARGGFAAAVLQGRIVVLGGEVLAGERRALDSVEILEQDRGAWFPGPSLPVGLHGVPAVAMGENLYVLGGSDKAGSIENYGRVLFIPAAALLGPGSSVTLDPTPAGSADPVPPAAGAGDPTPFETAAALPAAPTAVPTEEPALEPVSEAWVEAVLAGMTLEGKVGQMLMVGVDGREASPETCSFLASIRPGGVIFQRGNAYNPGQARDFTGDLQTCAETAIGVPLLIAVDHEGEYVNRFNEGTTTFPAALAQGATGDPLVAYTVALAAGQELAYSGVNMVLGPVADVLANYDNEVVSQRTFGGDPALVSQFVGQAVQGYRQAGLVPVLKHFPGHGGVAGDSHKTLPVDPVDRSALESGYLPPFRSGLEAGAQVVMLAHVAFPMVTGSEQPASLSPDMVRLLRSDLGFNGLVLSDSMNMQGATGGVIPVEEVSLAAVKAGVDQLLVTSPHYIQPSFDRLLAAVQSGEIPLEQVDASVRRILAVKANAGLASFPLPGGPEPDWLANSQLAQEVGRRAVALFKNEAGLVPIPAGIGKILVIAPQAEWALYSALESGLLEHGHSVEFAYYPPPWEGPVSDAGLLDSLPARAAEFDLVLLFTWQVHLNRLTFGDEWQAVLAERLVGAGQPLVVIAIKSPTDLLSLPPLSTYMVMFGSTTGQSQAVLEALTGAGDLVGQNPLPGPGK